MAAWAIFHEVKNDAGDRFADVIAASAWSSRRFEVWGFEVKASRGDWQRELQQPEKSEYFVARCDRWYVVAARPGVVRKEELPQGWGLMEMQDNGVLRQVVPAQLNLSAQPDRPFYAAILRRAHQEKQRSAADEEVRAAERRGEERGRRKQREDDEAEIRYAGRQGKDAVEVLRKFREATGIHLESWNVGERGKVIGEIYRSKERERELLQSVQHVHEVASRIARETGAALEAARKEDA